MAAGSRSFEHPNLKQNIGEIQQVTLGSCVKFFSGTRNVSRADLQVRVPSSPTAKRLMHPCVRPRSPLWRPFDPRRRQDHARQLRCKHLPFLFGEHRRLGHIGPADRVRLQIGAVTKPGIIHQAHGNRYLGFARDRTDQDAIKLNRRQRNQRTIGLACGGVQNRKVIGHFAGAFPVKKRADALQGLFRLCQSFPEFRDGSRKGGFGQSFEGFGRGSQPRINNGRIGSERSRRGNRGGVGSSLTGLGSVRVRPARQDNCGSERYLRDHPIQRASSKY